MDLLSVTNLVNYFGKATDVENITVSPLLLQKGKRERERSLLCLSLIHNHSMSTTYIMHVVINVMPIIL